MDSKLVRASKFLCLVLRHQPHKHGVTIDEHGWAQIDDVIRAVNRVGMPLTPQTLEQIVNENDKKRFAISADGRAIRARYGHSIAVDLELAPLEPPQQLYHGTAERFIESIRAEGLKPGSRQFVHLSEDVQTAGAVGKRHGIPVVLTVNSNAMYRDGFAFFRSENGVWLTGRVPVEYLLFPA
ncbi:MAG: RNA 2'-phosphotransferase [Anaerolineales bacterium]